MGVRINTRRFSRAMKRAPRRLSAEVTKGMKQHALAFDAHMKRTRFGGGDSVQSRTGRLARSMGSVGPRDTGRVGSLRMRLFIGQGIAKRYARIQEYGGTVTPTSSKYLTIPLPDNLTAANKVPKYKSARALMSTGKTFLWRGPSGSLVIGLTDTATAARMGLIFRLREAGKIPASKGGGGGGGRSADGKASGRIQWLWVLKKKVRLRPRLGFIKTINGREMRTDRAQRINAAVRRALRPAPGGTG